MNTKNKKLNLAVLFGGKSSEHEVSLQSAQSIIEALDKTKYNSVLIGITKSGLWQLQNQNNYFIQSKNSKTVKLGPSSQHVLLQPGKAGQEFAVSGLSKKLPKIDAVFPVLHGSNGEDGSVQGLLQILNLPVVGPNLIGSAVGMDKDITKRLLREAGLPIGKFIVLENGMEISWNEVVKVLASEVFVKPANSGSSVGVSKAINSSQFKKALQEAYKYDNKILVEQAIVGREIEMSVLGNEDVIVSIPGEVIPNQGFYSYTEKYSEDNDTTLDVPAKNLDKKRITELQNIAASAYQVLGLSGMARVDVFLKANGQIVINELNTIPGFTKMSMYPKLWEASGLPYSQLLDALINLAIEYHTKQQFRKTSI